jgi:hypothetical protein
MVSPFAVWDSTHLPGRISGLERSFNIQSSLKKSVLNNRVTFFKVSTVTTQYKMNDFPDAPAMRIFFMFFC